MSSIYDIGGTSCDCFSINGKVNILQGDDEPKNIQGKNGDVYLQSVGTIWSKRNNMWQKIESSFADWEMPTKNNQFVVVSPDGTGFKIDYIDSFTADDMGDFASKSKENTFTKKNVFNVGNEFKGNNTFNDNTTFKSSISVDGNITTKNTINTSSATFLKNTSQNYSVFFRNDDNKTYFLLTDKGNPNGTFNNLRPIAIDNATGNISFGTECSFTKTINGTALFANWGDLAEYYESDKEYPKGTLVQFGGEKEITIASDDVNAVITSEPGVMLNSQMENGQGIALVGRVPVRVIGKVNKFDYLHLSSIPGVAESVKNSEDEYPSSNVIARALESKDNEEEGLVLCVIKFEI